MGCRGERVTETGSKEREGSGRDTERDIDREKGRTRDREPVR